jgi:anti-sigma regulatory factor (Ser/Thr protein kinase)
VTSDNGPAQGTLLCATSFTAQHLRRVRQLVLQSAHRAGLDNPGTQNLVIAVHEAAINAIQHAGGQGELAIIQVGQRRLIAQITDCGPGLPPQLNVTRPPPEAAGGRGLWLIMQSGDRVQISSNRSGTTVRIEMMVPEQ